MKKSIYLSIMFLVISLTMSAQARGGQITRKKTNTTTTQTHTSDKKTQNAQNRLAQQRRAAQLQAERERKEQLEQERAERERIAKVQAERERQEQAAREQAAKADRTRILQNLINNMVYVEGGTFMMGATAEQKREADNNEKPAHQVTLSSYSIGKYEVTQEEWQAVMGINPSDSKGSKRPVENVRWNDCQEFIRKLNAVTGKHFRLPTEAEWEYAARGGNRSRGYKYAGSNDLNTVAWYDGNSGIHEVGVKQPNELGLYDMSGNVWEWCSDWYGSYNSSTQTNPAGPSSGSYRVNRGGSWLNDAGSCRVSFRSRDTPGRRYSSLGFRLAQ